MIYDSRWPISERELRELLRRYEHCPGIQRGIINEHKRRGGSADPARDLRQMFEDILGRRSGS